VFVGPSCSTPPLVTLITVHHDTLLVPPDVLARYGALLAPEELNLARRYRFPRDRRRFIVRRARLRERLGAVINARPERLIFTTNDHGKPAVIGGPHFSHSHSGDEWLLAIGEVECGIDIEAIDAAVEWLALTRTFFAPEEIAALTALSEADGMIAFFRVWAAKEAYVKAIGLGLSHPLTAFAISTDLPAAITRGGDGLALTTPLALPGHATALVARADHITVRLASRAP